MTRRFRDSGRIINDYTDEYLVRCPQCGRCATVTRVAMATENRAPPSRVVCAACGYAKDQQGHYSDAEGLIDRYFGLPLWLQIPCCGQTLWAFNPRHLRAVEAFVAAELRERSGIAWAHVGYTMVDKLPGWITRAENRDAILRCIAKLHETLA